MKFYISAWKNIFNFKGRASKEEYNGFVIFSRYIVIAVILLLLIIAVSKPEPYGFEMFVVAFVCVYGLMHAFSWVSLSVRRLHDVGYSGKVWFINLIPFFGYWYFNSLINDEDIV